jgi:hypothetical protein
MPLPPPLPTDAVPAAPSRAPTSRFTPEAVSADEAPRRIDRGLRRWTAPLYGLAAVGLLIGLLNYLIPSDDQEYRWHRPFLQVMADELREQPVADPALPESAIAVGENDGMDEWERRRLERRAANAAQRDVLRPVVYGGILLLVFGLIALSTTIVLRRRPVVRPLIVALMGLAGLILVVQLVVSIRLTPVAAAVSAISLGAVGCAGAACMRRRRLGPVLMLGALISVLVIGVVCSLALEEGSDWRSVVSWVPEMLLASTASILGAAAAGMVIAAMPMRSIAGDSLSSRLIIGIPCWIGATAFLLEVAQNGAPRVDGWDMVPVLLTVAFVVAGLVNTFRNPAERVVAVVQLGLVAALLASAPIIVALRYGLNDPNRDGIDAIALTTGISAFMIASMLDLMGTWHRGIAVRRGGLTFRALAVSDGKTGPAPAAIPFREVDR